MRAALNETMTRNNLQNLEENCEKIGYLGKGDSYGLWTLLSNKVMVRSMSGIASTDTKVSYFRRNHFFEALMMGLTSRKPEILRVLWNLPVFSKIPKFQILGNISRLRLCTYKYGEALAEEGEQASFAFILKTGKLNVKNFYFFF